jgi:hypothetical protein
MLTKQDLSAIGNLIDTKLKVGLSPIQKDIKIIKKDVNGLKKYVAKLREDLTTTINFFDKSDQDIKTKLNKTRSDIGLRDIEFAY